MTEQKSSDNRLALIGLVLTGLSVLIGLVQIWDTTRLAIKAVVDLPAPVGWILVGVLFVVGAALVVNAVTKKSILLRPEALRLDPKNPDHMIGREDDIQSLIKSCRGSPLVFLVGESGAGKSTLVNVGLRPALVNSGPLLPIYVDVCGQDWEDGPRRALTDAMWEALDDDGRHTLGSDEFQNADDLKIHFSRFKAKLGRSPLVIFDQFDDYQSRHRRHFFPGNRRTWLPAKQLIERNTFWRDVADLLEQGHISCLFVTRNDTANGLESVRFIEPGSYPLDRVQSNLVVSLLDKITSANGDIRPAILNPERGWDRLKNRLATDLSEQGAVLPQQMKTVLAGLATLPRRHLTIANYERVRGVTGLEARHIESRVQGAARQTGMSRAEVRSILVAMVDREAAQHKTIPQSFDQLNAALKTHIALHSVGQPGEQGERESELHDGLEYLQRSNIVRRRIDPDTRQHVWLLDHDYLCRGVLESQRLANRWAAAVEEGHQAFQAAGDSLLRRWRALLGLRPQIQLLWLRLFSPFRYREHRTYALWSAARFLPVLCVLGAIGAGVIEYRKFEQFGRDKASARELLLGLSFSNRNSILSHKEIDNLWRLAQSPDGVRDRALELLFESREAALRFNRRPELIVRAVVGLSPSRREHVLESHLSDKPFDSPDLEFRLARINLALLLAVPGTLVHEAAAKTIVEHANGENVRSFAQRWPIHVSTVASKDRYAAVSAIANRLSSATHPMAARALAQALQALAAGLTAEQARAATGSVLKAMERQTDPGDIRDLAQALQALPAKLTAEQARAATGSVLKAMEGQADRGALHDLAQALQALAARLTGEQARAATGSVLKAMERQTDPGALHRLARTFLALAAKLTAEQAFSQVAWWFAVSRGAYVVDLLRTSIERIDQETSNKYIVELIKHPTSGHRETQQLLTILGELNGAGAFENDVWRAVDWAKRKGLDVTSQAKRPRPEGITTAAPRTISKNAR